MMRDDLVIAMRRLVRKPGSAISIAFLLAIAMASVGCVFAVAYHLLSKPLPYPAQERLAQLSLHSLRMGMDLGWSGPYLDAMSKGSHQFEAIAGYRQNQLALFDDSGRYVGNGEAVMVEPSLLGLIGARVASGRLLLEEDARSGAEPVALVSQDLSNRQFGGPAAALGKKLRAGGQAYRIVGILAPGAAFPSSDIGIWLPMGFSQDELALENAGSFGNLRAIGLLKHGGTFQSASAEMMRLARSDAALEAIANEIDLNAEAKPLRYVWVEGREAMIKSMLVAVLLVFAVAIANASSLFMLRMLARRQEYALLQAMGASRSRRAVQTCWEAALLTIAAAIAGGAAIPLGIALLRSFDVLPTGFPQPVGYDLALVCAIALMGIVAMLALSLAGLTFRSGNVYEVLRQTGNGQTASRAAYRARLGLVMGQAVVTFVLLFGTLLLMRSSERLLGQDVGFERGGRLVGTLQSKTGDAGESVEGQRNQIASLVAGIGTLPGVQAVALSTSVPFSRMVSVEAFRPKSDDGGRKTLPNAYVSYVSWQYPQAMGLPLLRGRSFTSADAQAQAPVALIDQDLASQYFGDADPLGSSIGVNDSSKGEIVDVTIAGVVGRVRQRTLLSRDEYPSIYLPEAVPYRVHGMPTDAVEVVIKADRPALVAELVRNRVQELAPSLRFGELVTMERRISDTIIDQLRLNRLLQILGMVTLLLTLAGLYALLANSVALRTREFGVRMALGATSRDLVVQVFKQGGRMIAIALAIAIPLALLLGTLLKDRLFEISPFDPPSLATVALLSLLVQCVAAALPAYRSSRMEPMRALRME
ncbi:ABC transporter permease [[Pseudomonas] boreopolis]|uniref:ABC transporter permease n=1 Tax=Xanthomonas boreopolis TaxID=86183 RepID=UPI003D9B1875